MDHHTYNTWQEKTKWQVYTIPVTAMVLILRGFLHLPSVLCQIQSSLWFLGSQLAEAAAPRVLVWLGRGTAGSAQEAK